MTLQELSDSVVFWEKKREEADRERTLETLQAIANDHRDAVIVLHNVVFDLLHPTRGYSAMERDALIADLLVAARVRASEQGEGKS